MAPLRYAAKFDPFLSLDCPPPWRNPRKGRDQILPSGNLDYRGYGYNNYYGGYGGQGYGYGFGQSPYGHRTLVVNHNSCIGGCPNQVNIILTQGSKNVSANE